MAKKTRTYVLFGCPVAVPERYEQKGYVGLDGQGSIALVEDIEDAFKYEDSKEPGHGTPDDWAKLFKEDYGLNVRPVKLAKEKEK